MPLNRAYSFCGLTFAFTAFVVSGIVPAQSNRDYDLYDYWNTNITYDQLEKGGREPNNNSPSQDLSYAYPDARGKIQAVIDGRNSAKGLESSLPLCCPEGEVYDHVKCILPPSDFGWAPFLDGATGALMSYNGFPMCSMKRDYIQTYQKEVHFNIDEAKAFLPYHVKLLPVSRNDYCIAKVYDPAELNCKDFQTKIFTCYSEDREPQGILWTFISISHLFILFSLLAFFLVSELRCLQGQYMICFLISFLIYNLCLYPGSYFPMDISDVSCIALGAVKYFFFCGIFLWFNTICFDIWRTVKNKQDICGRRRFLFYSAYSWVIGAILTTVVLVMPYLNTEGGSPSRNDPLKDGNYDICKLKMPMNMILQIAQVMSLVLDLIFLVFATCCMCSYTKFGNGLPRSDASLCLKQGWKLFIIMLAHTISCIDRDIMQFPAPFWLYVLLESTAIFGVFTYRRTIMKKLFIRRVCSSPCTTMAEPGSSHEKGQLTLQ